MDRAPGLGRPRRPARRARRASRGRRAAAGVRVQMPAREGPVDGLGHHGPEAGHGHQVDLVGHQGGGYGRRESVPVEPGRRNRRTPLGRPARPPPRAPGQGQPGAGSVGRGRRRQGVPPRTSPAGSSRNPRQGLRGARVNLVGTPCQPGGQSTALMPPGAPAHGTRSAFPAAPRVAEGPPIWGFDCAGPNRQGWRPWDAWALRPIVAELLRQCGSETLGRGGHLAPTTWHRQRTGPVAAVRMHQSGCGKRLLRSGRHRLLPPTRLPPLRSLLAGASCRAIHSGFRTRRSPLTSLLRPSLMASLLPLGTPLGDVQQRA